MPHAAFCVVQCRVSTGKLYRTQVSMPHAAFCVVQSLEGRVCYGGLDVSMPHAAFCVVQCPASRRDGTIVRFQCRTRHSVWCNRRRKLLTIGRSMFQCRTRHSVWCNVEDKLLGLDRWRFNAARGILCGAIPTRASIVPHGVKRRIGKSRIFPAHISDSSKTYASKLWR